MFSGSTVNDCWNIITWTYHGLSTYTQGRARNEIYWNQNTYSIGSSTTSKRTKPLKCKNCQYITMCAYINLNFKLTGVSWPQLLHWLCHCTHTYIKASREWWMHDLFGEIYRRSEIPIIMSLSFFLEPCAYLWLHLSVSRSWKFKLEVNHYPC